MPTWFAVTMIENITQRKVAESALVARSQLNEYQAVHDALTDLPNRTLFRQRIQHAVARSQEEGEFAVVIMDLDRAKRSDLPFAVYDSTHTQSDPSRLTLVAAGLASGAVDSVEALVRWNHPERGLVFPDEFIPLAQETGLIRPLTQYVLEEAIRQCRAWQAEGIGLSVSVNLSARNLLDVEFPDQVERLLSASGLEPARLELEITETTMLNDGARTKAALDRLSALGVRISIDDFGTGYSSLSYLRQLPISEIKIDRSFVMNMDSCEDDAVIVRSTIDLGRNLGLRVVAEGVENEAVWTQLRLLGCTSAQGYYLTKPVPADDLRTWLRERAEAAARDDQAA